MGNFSRNTFDPLKNYVGVRLQQGVPVLDADWNELNDVTRQELYDAFSLTFADGTQPGGSDLEVQSRPEPNDFNILAGAALVRGRLVRVRNNLRYSTQPWTDPKRAARDGVAVIPPLTTPPGPPEGAPPRNDIVYLDVWDREVGSDEDADLINPAIGVETCVRIKREAAVRVAEGVAEGTTKLPAAPEGHQFLPLALLRRPGKEPLIKTEQIKNRRPVLHSLRGSREASFFPAFLPVSSPEGEQRPAWKISFTGVEQPPTFGEVPKFGALKTPSAAAFGVLPLILLDGVFLTHLSIRGHISDPNGELQWQLLRIHHPFLRFGPLSAAKERFDILHEDTIRSLAGFHVFDTSYALPSIDPAKLIVDNSRYYYALFAQASKQAVGYYASIHGVSIRYEY
jgi:hypothetical protein